MRNALISILLFQVSFLSAQVLSKEGRFSIEQNIGCAPFEVSISELDDFGDISRQYIFEEGLTETDQTTHIYQQEGTYTIVQIVGVDVEPKTDTLFVEVRENRSIVFNTLQ